MKKNLNKNKPKVAVFSSCSANYLAKAVALSQSVKAISYDVDFHLIYCDKNQEALTKASQLGKFHRVHDLDSLGINESELFKFDVMEICTRVKPNVLCLLLEEYDFVIYMDPDAIAFEPIDSIINEFDGFDIGLTPHFSKPINTLGESYRLTELSVLRHGIYNLGFLFVNNSVNAKNLAKWWLDRLIFNCYDNPLMGKFTDQRTFDLVPVNFEKVKISKAATINTASWNLHERDLSLYQVGEEVKYLVDGDPLLMYHFSGVNSKGVSDYVINRVAPDNLAIRMLENWYKNLLVKNQQEYFEMQVYFADLFSTGKRVSKNCRRLYAENADLQIAFPAPLSDKGYYNWLLNERNYLKFEFPEPTKSLVKSDFIRLFDYRRYAALADISFASDSDGFKKCLLHYVDNSTSGKINPNRFFDSNFALYSADFPISSRSLKQGLEAATPLYQFLALGSQSIYKPNRFFDEKWYLSKYPDVQNHIEFGRISSGFVHYCIKGAAEGRDPGPLFSEERYLTYHPDVKKAIDDGILVCGFDHFISNGLKEGRNF